MPESIFLLQVRARWTANQWRILSHHATKEAALTALHNNDTWQHGRWRHQLRIIHVNTTHAEEVT